MHDEQKKLMHDIHQLPCFKQQAIEVSPIAFGLSHFCFHVIQSPAKNPSQIAVPEGYHQHYFVKYLVKDTAEASSESVVAELAADFGIAPKVFYRSDTWLVTEFIDGRLLSQIPLFGNEKVQIAIQCVNQCHQLKPANDVPSLSISAIVSRQLEQVLKIKNTPNQTLEKDLTLLCQQVVSFNEVGEKVLCHGDVNFSNILIDEQQKPWLIDFECAFIGYREFDLAMLMAINQLPLDSLNYLIKQYQDESSKTLDTSLVKRYLACCYVINGLWFFHHASTTSATSITSSSEHYLELAQQQCQLFDRLKSLPIGLSALLFD